MLRLWLCMQNDHQRLRTQQEAATAATTAAAEAMRKASEMCQRAEGEVKAVRAMEEQNWAWLQRKVAKLGAKVDAAAAAAAAAEEKALASAIAAEEQQHELARSRQQLQAQEEAQVPILPADPILLKSASAFVTSQLCLPAQHHCCKNPDWAEDYIVRSGGREAEAAEGPGTAG